MEALFLSSSSPTLHTSLFAIHQSSASKISAWEKVSGRGKLKMTHLHAVNDVVSAAATSTANPSQALLTWEIVAGSLAGVVPFVIAGIEFSKRIAAQRKCSVCNGSGLVLRDNKYYFRCPGCGGFLPWQSWKRFFSG